MYSRISIKNLTIGSFEVDGLRRINLIVGRNNSGKTTFLEGLFLLGSENDPHYATILGRLRGETVRRGPPGPGLAITVPQHGSEGEPGNLRALGTGSARQGLDDRGFRRLELYRFIRAAQRGRKWRRGGDSRIPLLWCSVPNNGLRGKRHCRAGDVGPQLWDCHT